MIVKTAQKAKFNGKKVIELQNWKIQNFEKYSCSNTVAVRTISVAIDMPKNNTVINVKKLEASMVDNSFKEIAFLKL